jgi:hypothetical protein
MLTPEEKQRKHYLLNMYNRNLQLSYVELEELRDLIRRDEEVDEGIKLLLLFALGALIGYALSRDDR